MSTNTPSKSDSSYERLQAGSGRLPNLLGDIKHCLSVLNEKIDSAERKMLNDIPKETQDKVADALHIQTQDIMKGFQDCMDEMMKRETMEQEAAQKEIEDLTGAIDELTNKLAKMEEEGKSKDENMESLQKEVTRLTQEKEAVQQALSDKRNEIADLTGANKGLKDTIDELTNKMALLDWEEGLKLKDDSSLHRLGL
ncbi:PREDICTED: myosin-6-like [Branchiostoma belcheri]|uniref:Myosin-6-like n=1 Tax=Branchiostoma belcheri TaxID=7741 RepID=A0A6P4XBN7_BRABE|nr:PREDICTED: myosin-6-like [Branchiostoma belcheri]